jgi:hypothetical protein
MLPTYLVIAWFALPVLVSGAMLCVRQRIHPVLVCILCLASIIAGTIILANYVWALDAQLLAEIDKYEPGTPEAERASEEWASDTDRSFLLLLSPVLTGVWYSGLFLLLFGLQWVKRQVFPVKQSLPYTLERTVRLQSQRGDDGNPYQSPTSDNHAVNGSRR